ncbi:MAG TPA: Mut7-C RNAse domain-containing protein, partial [Motilibacteraceae bacterium]|nr:Mut7-C RNAse domain-containing protein [Motilibacteraceae bacterium]
MLTLRIEPSLRLMLPARHRAEGMVVVHPSATDSLGHVVQSLGVPLTEVGELRRDGEATAGSAPAGTGVVDVLPAARPQPLDGPPRLLLDVHLGALARRLRLLGVDAAYAGAEGSQDHELVERAGAEDRLLLTRDRGLLMRRALRRAAFVRGQHPDEQLADVLDRFRLPLAPWSRCTACGGELREVAKSEVLDRLEPGTRRTQERFARCLACGQVYWR